jgi:hypothetical protein
LIQTTTSGLLKDICIYFGYELFSSIER